MKTFFTTILICIGLITISVQAQEIEELESKDPLLNSYWDRVQQKLQSRKFFEAIPILDSLSTDAYRLGDQEFMAKAEESLGYLAIFQGKFDDAKYHTLRALKVFENNEKPHYIGMMHGQMARIYQKKGQIDSALIELRKGQKYIPYAINDQLPISLHHDLAYLFRFIGETDSAFYYQNLVINNLPPDDSLRLSSAYVSMASIFSQIYDYEKASEFISKAIEYVKTEKYPLTLANHRLNQASLKINMDNLEDAETLIKQARQYYKEVDRKRYLYKANAMLADVRLRQDRIQEASNLLEEVKGFDQEQDKELIAGYQITKLNLALRENKLKEAGERLKIARDKLAAIDQIPYRRNLSKAAAEYYEKTNQPQKQLLALQDYHLLKDSLSSMQRTLFIENLQTKYETEKKESEIAQLRLSDALQQSKISQQRLVIFGLVSGLLLFGLLLYRIFKQNKKIYLQNEIIGASLQEKETLLREIHHRVKNNLQVISSLLRIQSNQTKDQVAIDALKEGQSRVQSMSLIHQDLYRKNNLSGIKMKDYLAKLSQNLVDTYSISPERIELITDIGDFNLDVETVVPVGLIINELISNALKYAFPGDAQGTIKVSLHEEKNQLNLMVVDDGVGIEVDEKNEHGFGMGLIEAFANKLDADVKLRSNNGTQVYMTIKDYKKVS